MLIRQATVGDAHQIAAIHVRSWQAAYRGVVPDSYLDALSVDTREKFWRKGLLEGQSVLVAEDGDGLLGWLSVGPSRDEDADRAVGEVYAIYVAPEHWHQNVGTRLWALGRDELGGKGYRFATLWVLEDNRLGRRFYENLGFVPDAQLRKTISIGGKELIELRYRATLASALPA